MKHIIKSALLLPLIALTGCSINSVQNMFYKKEEVSREEFTGTFQNRFQNSQYYRETQESMSSFVMSEKSEYTYKETYKNLKTSVVNKITRSGSESMSYKYSRNSDVLSFKSEREENYTSEGKSGKTVDQRTNKADLVYQTDYSNCVIVNKILKTYSLVGISNPQKMVNDYAKDALNEIVRYIPDSNSSENGMETRYYLKGSLFIIEDKYNNYYIGDNGVKNGSAVTEINLNSSSFAINYKVNYKTHYSGNTTSYDTSTKGTLTAKFTYKNVSLSRVNTGRYTYVNSGELYY